MLKWIMGFFIGCCQLLFLKETLALPWLFLGFITSATIPVFFILFVKNYQSRAKYIDLMTISALLLNGFFAGLYWSNLNAHWRLQDKAHVSQISKHIIEAKVVSMPQVNRDKQYFHINVTKIDEQLVDLTWSLHDYFPRNRTFYKKQSYKPIQFKLGETWRLSVRAKPIAGNLNSAGFDYELWAFTHNLSATATLNSNSLPQRLKPSRNPLTNFRQWLLDKLEPLEFSGFYQALLLGEKQGISKTHKNIISGLGINHLLAISGLHIAIIAALGFFLGKTFFIVLFYLERYAIQVFNIHSSFLLKVQPQYLSIVCSIFCAFIYTSLANYSLPTLRAFIMCLVSMMALLLYQNITIRKVIAIALLVILILFPLSVLEVSFWFTFSAVIVIALFLSGRLKPSKKIALFIRLQVFLTLLMMLASGFVFSQFSGIAFLANCLLIPVFSTIFLPLVFISALLLLFGFNGLFDFLDVLLKSFFDFLIKFDTASWALDVYLDWAFFSILILLLLVTILPLGRQKNLLFTGIFSVFSVIYINSWHQSENNHAFIKFFDVGHGVSILYHDGKQSILYDTGHGTDDYSVAESQIIPYLKKLGIDRLDMLIVSHSDRDHSGGLEPILKNFKVGELIYNRRGDLQCYQGLSWNYSELNIRALWPLKTARPTLKNNDLSCVLMFEVQGKKILFTGDIEKRSEYDLANFKQKIKADFLVSPHHGSNTSSRYPFIKNVQPKMVIHSSKRYGRFVMPHPDVVQRYQSLSIEQLSTACYGEITLDLITGKISYVRQIQKIWRNRVCGI